MKRRTQRDVPRPARRSNFFLLSSQLINLALLLAVVCLATAYTRKGKLPVAGTLHALVLQEPQQRITRKRTFSFSYYGNGYVVQPVADYSISGVVVTHNNPTGFGDIYHDESSVDIRDLCLVWGSNLESGTFRQMRYWSEPWTCWARPESQQAYAAFRMNQLSNNHLLSSDPVIREKIRRVHIGDQVRMQGMLVNYWPEGAPGQSRNSSLSREDTGNGACEVFFVTDIEVLRQATPMWYAAYERSLKALILLILLRLAAWVLLPWLEYRYG